MAARGDDPVDLRIDIAGVGATMTVASPLAALVSGSVSGVRRRPTGEPSVGYRLIAEGPGRFGVERDEGGLRRDVDAKGAVRTLVTDLADVVHRRRPDIVLARAGAVAVAGRGIVVLGPPGGGTTTLVSALVDAGATLLSDGLAALDRDGRVHPIVVWGDDRSPADDAGGLAPPAAVPVAMILSTGHEPDTDWRPTEVSGVRAVLGLLDHVVPHHQPTPTARELVGRLARHVLELRGPRPEAPTVAEGLITRAGALPVVDLPTAPPSPPEQPAPVGDHALAPARFLRFDDLLGPEEHRWLLDHALSREAELSPSKVLTAEEVDDTVEVRRSLTSYDLAEIWELFESRLVHLLPSIRRELGIDWFHLGPIERQLTVHGDGDHFTMHIDNGGPDVASRIVSAVYYFNQEPRRFSGGELRLFDTIDRHGSIEPAATFTEVVPADNTLVVFPSDAPHEVRPVHVPGDSFADRRFTVVFWARRAPTVAELFSGDSDELADLQHDLIPSLTGDGFRVMATPASVQERLAQAFASGSATAGQEGGDPNIMPSGDPRFVDLADLGEVILNELQGIHEDWFGAPLVPTAAFGLRVYGEGQTLARHVDRVATHIISSVVHVAADVDEPWPLVIEDLLGERHETFLEPGQMLLYEGARLPHSRPAPLRGRHYTSVFLHYRPVDWPRTLQRVCRENADSSRRSQRPPSP